MEKIRTSHRLQHMAVRVDNIIVVFGGSEYLRKQCCYGLIPCIDEIWIYNLYTSHWRKHVIPQAVAAPGRQQSCAIPIGADIYVFGGCAYMSQGFCVNELWKLTRNFNGCFRWSKIRIKNGLSPTPRRGHSCWEHENKVWVFGGFGTPPVYDCINYLNDNGDILRHPHHLFWG